MLGWTHRRNGRASAAIALCMAVCLSGCQREYRKYADSLAHQFEAGDFTSAASKAHEAASKIKPDHRDRVAYLLEAGRASQAAGLIEQSRCFFDEVHETLRPYLDTKAEAKATEAVATTVLNQTMEIYRGTPSDRMMACTLNALNYLALGNVDAARVELNRAEEWQQDATNRLAGEIEKADKKNQETASKKGLTVTEEQVLKNEEVTPLFDGIGDLRGYADYANPFVNHVRGVFYLSTNDPEKARFEFRQVAGMVPDARSVLESDLSVSESGGGVPPTTWVYFFTGLAPRLEELRLNIPIPVGNVNYVSAAFPLMKLNDAHIETMRVQGGGSSEESVLLADMDRIVGGEFRARLPKIIMQEVLSSALKALATYMAREQLGIWAWAAGLSFQAASTAADLRIWRTVPKRIGVCRIPTPADGMLVFEVARPIGSCQVAPGSHNIVLVSLPSSGTASASVLVAPLSPQAVAVSGSTMETTPP